MYIENCDISGAWDNAVDFVAVQQGHVVGSRIHRAGDWAMYAKGGSAYLTITGNEFFAAGTAAVVGLPALVSAGIRVDGRSGPRSLR